MRKDLTLTITHTKSTAVYTGCGILSDAGDVLKEAGVRGKAFVITHEEVSKLYGQALKDSLEKKGIKCVFIDIPSGEHNKQWSTVARILPILRKEQTDRSCAIGSLGGGVAGDLAGFVASIYMRGTGLFHVPTSLLAQVDSSLGGKTAVNYEQDKNLLGTFYQPQVIVADVDVLATLPAPEFAAGMAEAVKTALLCGQEFFLLLESALGAVNSQAYSRSQWPHPISKDVMADVVARCLAFKAQVVASDVLDMSCRHQLNLGHTFAHAIESATNFAVYSHGAAVGLGLLCALRLSGLTVGVDAALEQRVRAMLKSLGLPVTAELDVNDVLQRLKGDKKHLGGRLRFVGLLDVGRYTILEGLDESVLRAALQAI